jgi:cytochrome c oxidase assembly protein subunit 15
MQVFTAESRPSADSAKQIRALGFSSFAWIVLAYNVAVILWGALVRATKSGAGCGGNWPLCNGEFLPDVPQAATAIEFTHRLMSGGALIAVVWLFIWAFRRFPRGHNVRRWAAFSLLFILTEALIGAALVLLGHVAANESVGRVYSLGTHLVNTFLLLASLALTAWNAMDWRSMPPIASTRVSLNTMWPAILSLGAMIVVALAGAITALGDTLFPSHSLPEGITQDFSSTAHFLIRLRVIHPALAVAAGFVLAGVAARQYKLADTRRVRVLAGGLAALLLAQTVLGGLTVVLRAPVAMQITHLFVADMLWITLVLFVSEQIRAAELKGV